MTIILTDRTAAVDKWNDIYRRLKNGLLEKYGNAGPSPRTGNAMPKIPWGNAVAIGIEFSTWLRQAIHDFYVKSPDITTATPLLKVIAKPNDVQWPAMEAWSQLDRGYWVGADREEAINRYLDGQVVSPGYLLIPHPLAVVYQRTLDLTNRLDPRGPYIIGINRDGAGIPTGGNEADPVDVQWFGTAVREYTRLLHMPAEMSGVLPNGTRGAYGNLDAISADMFLQRVYAATQSLAIQIPSVGVLEAIERMIEMSAEAAAVVVNVAAEAASKGLNWTAEQLGNTVSTFMENLNIYGTIAVVGATYYFFLR